MEFVLSITSLKTLSWLELCERPGELSFSVIVGLVALEFETINNEFAKFISI
jgi:hypothetical protein